MTVEEITTNNMKNVNIENNGEMPINPTWYTQNGERSHIPLIEGQRTGYEYLSTGLSKREYFAVKAMEGLLSNPKQIDTTNFEWIASHAVGYADALLNELSKIK